MDALSLLQDSLVKVPTIGKEFMYLGGGAIAYLILEKTFNFVKYLLEKHKKNGNGNGNGSFKKQDDTKAVAVESAFEERKEADKEWRDDVRGRFDKVERSMSSSTRELGQVNTKLDIVISGLADVKKNCKDRLLLCDKKFVDIEKRT
jgi:hypothetical protein